MSIYSNFSEISKAQNAAPTSFLAINPTDQGSRGYVYDGSSQLVRNWDGTIHVTQESPFHFLARKFVAPIISAFSSIWAQIPPFTLRGTMAAEITQHPNSRSFSTQCEAPLDQASSGATVSKTTVAQKAQIATERDLALLEKAVAIARYIQKGFPTLIPATLDRAPTGNGQLEAGLAIEFYYGRPDKIRTPLGVLSIFNGGIRRIGDNFDKTVADITKSLGLELIHGQRIELRGLEEPLYAVRKWNGIKIEQPVERQPSRLIPKADVQKIWRRFVSTRPELFTQEQT